MTDRPSYYQHRADELAAALARLRRRNRLFLAGQLATFGLMLAALATYTVADSAGVAWLWMAALMLAAYLAVRWKDGQNSAQTEQLEDLHRVYQHELQYLAGHLEPFDDGQRYADPRHPYTFDLDVFGPQSLFQHLCRAVSSGGADALAALLSSEMPDGCDEIARRREAVGVLAEAEPWRAVFLAMGQRQRVDTRQLEEAVARARELETGLWPLSPLVPVVCGLCIAGFFGSLIAALAGYVSASVPIWWGLFHLAAAYLLTSLPLRAVASAVDRLHRQLQVYVRLTRHFTDAPFGSDGLLGQMQEQLRPAVLSFSRLERILRGLDRRGNLLGGQLANALFLSDVFLLRRFLGWQQCYGDRLSQWVELVSQLDMLVSMGTYRYNHPTDTDAEVVDSPIIIYRARDLRHPFLGAAAVGNDFEIADGHYYIVTGANMAGKSTFLRSVGVSCLAAWAGLPVAAGQLTVSRFALFTSMRTSDSLASGISYFNAELLRLQQLLGRLTPGRRHLIILDEILKGTNSLDKLNGSRMFLEAIARQTVSGIVATHDLELSRMADERPGQFHNYCFEIELSDTVTYTYKIAPGVARNQNATFLLKQLLDKGGLI
ncbi:MAG: DNA mismatch repair protein MutS [Prevotella sp.]|nr:DNA mismatch repair protein MutS [Prevotella sp.]